MKINKRKRRQSARRVQLMMLMCCIVAAIFNMTALSAAAAETEAETHHAVPYTSTIDTDSLRKNDVPVSYGLRVMADREEMVFSGLCGNEITFTDEDICRAMNLSSLNYIIIEALPNPGEGTLYVGSVGATEGQAISAGSLSLLSFAAKDDETPCEASMKFSVNGSGYAMTCKFVLTDKLNYTPTVSLAPAVSLTVETFSNLTTAGTLSAYDPEDDEMTYEIVKYATHGRVTLTDKHTGAYTYKPDDNYVGADAFTYVVRDKYGNYSTSAVVSITVSEKPTSVTYADIEGEAAASILRVSLSGVMNGTRVGADHYFKPAAAMTRLEFLVTAMHAAGIGEKDIAGLYAPSFADADEIPENMARYVSLAVRRGYVAGKQVDGKLCFVPNESISRAEAAVILSNIIGYAKQTTVTAFADAESMPAWSAKALNSLKSFGILAPGDGNADATGVMTRGDTAVWLDRTMRVISQS
ncbi:MAG: hypothetical protein E7661_06280 [Ruminococcaceae bacterium]|nr:hypothetical protein [Oscillospiraceae bacterium]